VKGPALAVVVVMSGGLAAAPPQEVPPDTTIRLERTICFGECPAYSVTIDAHGNVTYDGKQFVRVDGRQTDRVPPSAVRGLLDTAERIGFFQLHPAYRTIRNPDGSETMVTDRPTTFVSVTSGGRSKRIEDYLGAPKALREFERDIEAAARTKRWVRIDERALRELARTGRMPAQSERAGWLRSALAYDDVGVVEELLALGLDPDMPLDESNTTALMSARSAAATRLLLALRANVSATAAGRGSALHRSIYLAPEVAQLLVKAGAPVDAPDPDGRTTLWLASCEGNAGVAGVLLAAGADPTKGSTTTQLSQLDCAKQGREARRLNASMAFDDTPPPFVPDFDRTIALLQNALDARKKR